MPGASVAATGDKRHRAQEDGGDLDTHSFHFLLATGWHHWNSWVEIPKSSQTHIFPSSFSFWDLGTGTGIWVMIGTGIGLDPCTLFYLFACIPPHIVWKRRNLHEHK